MGGPVYWAGKPHASAYEMSFDMASGFRGSPVAPERTLVIGDALRTDLEGARRAGLDALFIAGGIHRDDVVKDGRLVLNKLETLFNPGDAPPAVGAMTELVW